MLPAPMTIGAITSAYKRGVFTPVQLIEELYNRIEASSNQGVWIYREPRDAVLGTARKLEARDPERLPLYGIPFVVKDNLDVAGWPTSAGCPDFVYTAEETAAVIRHLLNAGAILLGKTHLDQFATGLVGIRSQYNYPRNPFNADYIPGGSSSGSAVAVAEGFAAFALGTDTAGSGRVPAAFNNLIGLKPSRGLLSTRGVVPACRSLDCVSIFTLNAEDAALVFETTTSYDQEDPYSRRYSAGPSWSPEKFTFGIPEGNHLTFFGDTQTEALFRQSVKLLESIGGTVREIDFSPFSEAARLLYEGPWVAERYIGIETFLQKNPQSIFPITYKIIESGIKPSAVDLFKAQHRLQALKRRAEIICTRVDFIIMPTTPTHYTVAEVQANPFELNSRLGIYTNFMNLLDFAAVAVPAGFVVSGKSRGMPWGVTIFAPAFSDRTLLKTVARMRIEAPAK